MAWGALIIGAVYMLRAIRSILHGPLPEHLAAVRDASAWRKVPFALLAGSLLVFGIFPKMLTDKIKPSAESIVGMAIQHAQVAPPLTGVPVIAQNVSHSIAKP